MGFFIINICKPYILVDSQEVPLWDPHFNCRFPRLLMPEKAGEDGEETPQILSIFMKPANMKVITSCIHTYIYICIIRTYIHTYIHTYVTCCRESSRNVVLLFRQVETGQFTDVYSWVCWHTWPPPPIPHHSDFLYRQCRESQVVHSTCAKHTQKHTANHTP